MPVCEHRTRLAGRLHQVLGRIGSSVGESHTCTCVMLQENGPFEMGEELRAVDLNHMRVSKLFQLELFSNGCCGIVDAVRSVWL